MDRKEWLLIAIHAAKGRTLSPIQLQKSLFLIGQNLDEHERPHFYQFAPYNYGPFSIEIYQDAEELEQLGLVEIRRDGRRWPEYGVTQEGIQRAAELVQSLPNPNAGYMRTVVEWTQSLSFPALVRAIYQAFPEYKQNSVFQD